MVAGEVVIVILTAPLALLTVQLDVPEPPTGSMKLVGEQVSERAFGLTLNVTVAECDRAPLVPVTPTWNVPLAVKVQERIEVPEPVTLVGATEQDVLLLARFTRPANPF